MLSYFCSTFAYKMLEKFQTERREKMQTKRIGVDVPLEVYTEIKILAIQNHSTLKEYINQLIKNDITKKKSTH